MIPVIATQQLRTLHRLRVSSAFVGILIAMSVLAGGIGWSSHNTIVRVYGDAARLLTADGKGAPPNPFEQVATLSPLSNLAIYFTLIGALMAVIIGHFGLAGDQSSGIGRLVFSRPVSRSGYIIGKLVAVSVVVAAGLLASMAVSVVALRVANGTWPGPADISRLAGFLGISWLYLTIFVVIGMVTVLMCNRRSLALLIALGAWLVITFALPQFTSGLRPTTSLNPVNAPAGTSQTFFQITGHARPISIAEQYKSATAQVLGIATDTPSATGSADLAGHLLALSATLVVLVGLAGLLMRHRNCAEASTDD